MRTQRPRPPRLDRIFDCYDPPLFFVTTCAAKRKPLLACTAVQCAVESYAQRGLSLRCALGRYALMPDHIHLFVQLGGEITLGRWMKGLKAAIGEALHDLAGIVPPIWEPGFFDHLIRHSESYDQKWHYVRDNPMRAKLVEHFEDWPWQGEPVRIACSAGL
jgi:putative transposase